MFGRPLRIVRMKLYFRGTEIPSMKLAVMRGPFGAPS